MRMDDSVSIGKADAALPSQSQREHDMTTVILCQLTSGGLECGVPWQADSLKCGGGSRIGPSPA